jgi:carbon monoxide dehydrogenase subunit G
VVEGRVVQFQNSFDVEADPDAVYRFLLDVREVVTCVPGAELTEVADGDTYEGRMKVKVGAIQTSYKGSASIVDRNETARSAALKAKGRETTGAGAATMQASLSVTPTPTGSTVLIATELTITGRVAQFGRGVIEDVSKHLVDQMANCIKEKIEHPPASAVSGAPVASGDSASTPETVSEPPPLNLFAVLFAVLRKRIARIFRRRPSEQAGAEPKP